MKRRSLIVIIILLMAPSFAFAQSGSSSSGSVNLNVNIVERKSTDTINDFLPPTFSATAGEQGRVLGAQAQRTTTSDISKFVKIAKQVFYIQILPWWGNVLIAEKIINIWK